MKRAIGLLMALAIGMVLHAQTATEYSLMAKAKMDKKDYQYAMVFAEKAVALEPKEPWWLILKAEIQVKLTGGTDAIEILKKALVLNPKFSETYNRMASYQMGMQKEDEAIANYTKAIEYATSDTMKHMLITNRGSAKDHMRDFKGAIEDYLTVLKFDPNDIATLNNIAMSYQEVGMVDKSIESLKRVAVIDSEFIGAYVNLGFIYSDRDSIDLAISYFEKALKLEPSEPITMNNLGYAYYKKKDYGKASTLINKSIMLYSTNSYAYRNLALVYIAQENFKEACTTLAYAEGYGFTKQYGNEVENLISKYCERR